MGGHVTRLHSKPPCTGINPPRQPESTGNDAVSCRPRALPASRTAPTALAHDACSPHNGGARGQAAVACSSVAT